MPQIFTSTVEMLEIQRLQRPLDLFCPILQSLPGSHVSVCALPYFGRSSTSCVIRFVHEDENSAFLWDAFQHASRLYVNSQSMYVALHISAVAQVFLYRCNY